MKTEAKEEAKVQRAKKTDSECKRVKAGRKNWEKNKYCLT